MDDYIDNIKYKYPFYVIIFCYTEAWVEALKSRALSVRIMETNAILHLFLIQVFYLNSSFWVRKLVLKFSN